ncbi:MAG: hypothetical protein E6686_10245 [Lachnospiraceae bacterium]|nr:hypothetical protein [Lachnospiraceae bacterium]
MELFEQIIEELELASYRTVQTFDEDGFGNDDSEEVIELDRAIEIIRKHMEEKVLSKLKEYEELEEQGKLLRLPIAVGDTVYTLNPLENGNVIIAETTADVFFCAFCALEGRFDKTVFSTYEEAKAALERREKEQC